VTDQIGSVPDETGIDPVETTLEPTDRTKFRVVAIVAAVLFAPQVIASAAVPFTIFPTFRSMFDAMGGTIPPATALLLHLGPWVGVILAVVDVVVFAFFYRLARRYWIGLLFAPLFAGGLLVAPLIWALYQPFFDVISLVK
jgi:type II secretory pathway component PulF